MRAFIMYKDETYEELDFISDLKIFKDHVRYGVVGEDSYRKPQDVKYITYMDMLGTLITVEFKEDNKTT